MHPGPPPKTDRAPSPAKEDGGEGESPDSAAVTTTCTAVCGPGHVLKYVSRRCILKVTKTVESEPM